MPPQFTNAVTICPLWSSTSTSKTLARKRSKRRKHCNRMVLRVIETHSTIIGFDSGKILLVGSSIGGVWSQRGQQISQWGSLSEVYRAMTNKFDSLWVVVISLFRSRRLLSIIADQSSLPHSESRRRARKEITNYFVPFLSWIYRLGLCIQCCRSHGWAGVI
jgi:hypothetical protein